MTSLIALLSSGKGTWTQVLELIAAANWEHVYLICNDFAYDNVKIEKQNITKLRFDEENPKLALKPLADFFKKEIKDFEVALNITSGSGMEHMVITSALLKAGLGIRFVYSENKKLKEFELLDIDYSKINEEDNF